MRQETGLWCVRDAARFLRRSPRWVWQAVARAPEERGSIPHVRLPGRRGGVRFVPEEIHSWLAAGCPPAGDFYKMREARRGGRG